MSKKHAAKKHAAKKKKLLNAKDTETLESKAIELQKVSKEKSLESVFLKESYIDTVEKIKTYLPILTKLSSIKLGDRDVVKSINEAIKNLGGSLNTPQTHPKNDYEFGLKYFANAFFGKTDNNLFFTKAINYFKKAKQNKEMVIYTEDIDVYLGMTEGCYISSDILEQNADSVKSNLSTLPHELLATMYDNNCKLLIKGLHLDYAKAAGKIAYDMLDSDQTISDLVKLNVLYIMAVCTSKYDYLKAIEYYEEAEKITPNDHDIKHDIIHDKFVLYSKKALFDMALMEAKKFPYDRAEVYKIHMTFHMDASICTRLSPMFNSLEATMSISNELSKSTKKGGYYSGMKAIIDAYQVDINKSIEVYKELVLSTVDDFSRQFMHFTRALSNYVHSYGDFDKKQVKSLMQFHKLIYKEVPKFEYHQFTILTYCECILFSKCHEMEKAKIKLDILNKLVKNDSSLAENYIAAWRAGEIYTASLIEAKDFTSALDFINNESIANEIDKQKNITLINKLIEAGELLAEPLATEQLTTEHSVITPAEQSTTFCLIDWAASSEELASYSDPRVINA